MGERATDIETIAALGEPARRSLYAYVTAQPEPVGRDQASRALSMKRSLAAFHLDALVEQGLLEASYRRLSGRTGPGAGRTSKLYRRSSRQVEVTLPPRRYALAAELLATAMEAKDPSAAVGRAARAFGRAIGATARKEAGSRAGRRALLDSSIAVLARWGFEPLRMEGEVRLRNCPFDALAVRHRTLVCGMNLQLMRGVVAALELKGVRADADPIPGQCCVTLRAPRPARRGGASGGALARGQRRVARGVNSS